MLLNICRTSSNPDTACQCLVCPLDDYLLEHGRCDGADTSPVVRRYGVNH